MNLNTTYICLLLFSTNLCFAQNYTMNAALTSVNDCGGFFMDSGGGQGDYGPNQDFTTTICPDLTTGTHVQLVFSGTDVSDEDDLCFFDGPDITAPLLGCISEFNGSPSFIIQATAVNNSGCLTLQFNSDASGEGAGWSADINCIPACQTILANLDSTDPIVEPADTGYIDICPGDRVFLWGSGEYPQNGAVYNHSDFTSSFEWDFGDGNTSFGPNVSHVFEEAGGYTIQLTITDQFNCENTNFITQRVRVAPRPNFATGDWPDEICVADTISLNAMVDSMDSNYSVSVSPGEESFQTSGIRSDSLALPDGNGSSYSTSISFSDFAPGQTLTDINDLLGIWVNMEHSWMRDLEITLTCPNGQSIILHDHPGNIGGEVFLGIPFGGDEGLPMPVPGVGYDYGWQVNPDYNNTWIGYANATGVNTLPSGSYQSFEPLSDLLGCPLNGDWEITVTDLWAIDNGFIFSWSIDFAQDLYPDIEVFNPSIVNWNWLAHPSTFYSENDSIASAPLSAGEVAYTFQVEDEYGCLWDTTAEVLILPQTHPDCRNCGDLLSPAADTAVCEGEQVLLDIFTTVETETEVTFESIENYPIGATNHPPANPYLAGIEINSINPSLLSDPTTEIVSVCLDLETDFDADIQLFLRSPTGVLLELSTNNGGSGDNYSQTCFTPTAATPIQSGTAPFTGNFQPEGNWNILNGAPTNGTWSLQIADAFGLNAFGSLNWWNITFRSVNDVDYEWDFSPSLSCDDCPDPLASPVVTETFHVSVEDDYGCIADDDVTVEVLDNFAAPSVSCSPQTGGQILFEWDDVAPGLNYEVNINGMGWIPANDDLAHLVTGLVNGDEINFEVRVALNGASCQIGIGMSFCSFALCPIDAFTSIPGPFSVSCNGACDAEVDITVLNGSGNYTFDVTNQTTGDVFTTNMSAMTGLCPGDYQVVVGDDFNCFDTVNFVVEALAVLTATTFEDNPVNCNGGFDGCASVLVTGGTTPYAYQWNDNNNSTGMQVCNLSAGSYSVTVTDANGCSLIESVQISEPPPITLDIDSNPVNCLGGNDGTATVTPSGGTSIYTYTWSAGDTPVEATTGGLEAGLYFVTVEDSNGCQAFANVQVDEPADALTVDAVQSVIGCFGQNNSVATATPVGGTGPFTYQWSVANQTQQSIDMLPIGEFFVTVTDVGGCTAIDSVSIAQLDPISINLAAAPPSCFNGLDGSIAANIVTGGAGNYSFLWNTGDMTDFINGVQGGLEYTITVTDSQGCTGMSSTMLENPPEIELVIETNDAFCEGSQDGVANVVDVQNNNGPVSYQWDAAALSQTTALADSLAAGAYVVVVTDASGCVYQELVEIGEPTGLELSFTTVDNECFGAEEGSLEVSAIGGIPTYQYNWSTGSAGAKISDLSAGVYSVTITDQNGCTISEDIEIEQPTTVTWQFNNENVSCYGGSNGRMSIDIQGGTPPFLYSLDNENFFGSSTLIALSAGNYTVYVQDNNGCVYQSETDIFQPSPISVEILSNNESVDELTISEGTEVQLDGLVDNGTGSIQYNWEAAYCGTLSCLDTIDCEVNMDCQMPVAFPDFTNDYFLTVVDENGCSAEDMVQIHVTKKRVIEVPTGFSPNSDDRNNRLVVHGRSETMVDLFQVFDRWGELMYEDFEVPINESAITGRGWDGTFKGEDMPSGVYIWYIEVTYSDGMKESFKGETTLVR